MGEQNIQVASAARYLGVDRIKIGEKRGVGANAGGGGPNKRNRFIQRFLTASGNKDARALCGELLC